MSEFVDGIHLQELATNLWRNRAALMIGSGFSRNSKACRANSQQFPLWNDLKLSLSFALHNRDRSKNTKESALKLAQEYEDYFGRHKLDELLINEIKTDDFEPGELHERLLDLPWIDIFTTNYDDLLERTLSMRNYRIVKSISQISSQQNNPRIVKLHGSLPTPPFIITEEDYRRYPYDYAPFVNTIQQSIMENSFCLLGFSGDDPNFLAWSGWVRDNLGHNQNPIYLIGDLDLSQSRRKYLERKLIQPIDLSPLINTSFHGTSRHSEATSLFISYLEDHEPPDPYKWPFYEERKRSYDWHRIIGEDTSGKLYDFVDEIKIPKYLKTDFNSEDLDQMSKKWKRAREIYPGWMVCPYKLRKRLELFIDRRVNLILRRISEVPAPLDIVILHELTWFLDTSLLPFFAEQIDIVIELIEKYNPFPGVVPSSACELVPEKDKWDSVTWTEISEMWIRIVFSVLRSLRINYRPEQYLNLLDNITGICRRSIDWEQRWYFEKTMFEILQLRFADAIQTLEKWPEDGSPIWLVRKASLMCQISEIEKANRLAEKAVKKLREFHSEEDPQAESELQWVTYFSEYLSRAQFRFSDNRHDRSSNGYIAKDEVQRAYYDALSVLIKSIEKEIDSKEASADSFRMVISSSPYDDKLRYGIANLLLLEECGIPFRIGISTNLSDYARVLKAVLPFLPAYISLKTVSAGYTGASESIITLPASAEFSDEEIVQVSERIFDYLKAQVSGKNDNAEHKILSSLKVLSTLSWRMPENVLENYLDVLLDIFEMSNGNKIKSMIISTEFNKALSETVKILGWASIDRLMERILSLSVHSEALNDPSVTVFEYRQTAMKTIQISDSQINSLIDSSYASGQTRKASLTKLAYLNSFGLIAEEFEERLREAVWKEATRCGIPVDIETPILGLYLPGPKNGKDYRDVLRDYLLNLPIPKIIEGSVLSHTNSFSHYVNLFVDASLFSSGEEKRRIDWTEIEAEAICSKVVGWWNEQQAALKELNGEVFEKSFSFIVHEDMITLVSHMIVPSLGEDNDKCVSELLPAIDVIEKGGTSVIPAYVALMKFGKYRDQTTTKIREGLQSPDEKTVINSIRGISFWQSLSEVLPSIPEEFITKILQIAENRSGDVLLESSRCIFNLIPRICGKDSLVLILCSVLRNIREITDSAKYNSTLATVTMKNLIKIREVGAFISSELYYALKENKGDIPEELSVWKELAVKEKVRRVKIPWEDREHS